MLLQRSPAATQNHTGSSQKQIELCMSAIHKAHAQEMAVGIHCTAGLGRTGVMVACYLIQQGMSAKNAIICAASRIGNDW